MKYAYDANGRLVAATAADGSIARYSYDPAGNVTAVEQLGSPAVAVLSAVPARVRPGDTLTLTGKGFTTTPGGNAVDVNGTAAVVTAATAEQLTITVGAASTSGAVTVTTAAGTASLPGLTVIRDDRPAVTGFAPAVVAPGGSLTLTVGNTDPEPANNLVRINGLLAGVTARTATTLTVTVPPMASTGPVTLSTPAGTATSATPVVVPPAGVSPSNVDTVEPIAVGTATSVPVAAGKYAIRYFPAADNDRFAASLSGGTFGSCGLAARLYDERNRQSSANTCAGGAAWVETGPVSGPGTRTVVLHNTTGSAGTTSVTVHLVPADLDAGPIALDGTAKPVTIANPGQNAFVSFSGTADQRVIIQSSAASSSFGCCYLAWWLAGPDGTRVGNTQSPNGTLDTIALPQTGTYRIWMNPDAARLGAMTFAAWTVPADVNAGAQALDGTPTVVTVASPGHNAFTTFEGTTNQRVIIQSSAASSSFGCCYLTWWLAAPDGTRVGNTQSPNATLDTITLPQTGTYRLIVNPDGIRTGSMTLAAWTVPADLDAGVQALDGTPTVLTIDNPGRSAYTTFEGTQNQRVIIQSSAASSSFGCCYLAWWLAAPDGTRVGSAQSPNSTLDTIALPQTGTYRIWMNPDAARTGAMTLRAWTVPADVNAGTQALDGTPLVLTVAAPGSSTYATFEGATGQRIIVQSSASSSSFGCCYLAWWLAAPDGTRVGNSQTPNSTLDTIALPQTGTYRIWMNPDAARTGAMTLRAWTVPADLDAGVQAQDGTPTVVTVANPGRSAFTTFEGTTGQRVIIQSSAASSSFGCCYLAWWLAAPNGARVGNTQSPNSTLDTLILPQTGTYRIWVNPDHILTGSLTIRAWDVPPDADAGPLPLTATPKTVTVDRPGQSAFAGFTGTAGQRVRVQSSASSSAFGCCGLTWQITGPDGTRVGNTAGPNAALEVTLPTTGAYRLLFNPNHILVGSSTYTASVVGTAVAAAPKPEPARAAPSPFTEARVLEGHKPARVTAPPQRDERVTTDLTAADAATPTAGPDPALRPDWTPDGGNLAGRDWLTRRGKHTPVANLTAPAGVTAVSGHVLGLDGKPLAGIPVRIDSVRTTTDAGGRFLLAGVRSNATTVVVDGYAAATGKAKYGTFRIRAQVEPGATTPLDATVWLPKLDMANTVAIAAPTTAETVLTTPDIPGLEVRLPAGTVVRDQAGNVVTELGITAIPLDRPPYPLPRNGIVPTYFTVQPGGATIFPQGASVVYPNYTGLPAGSTVDFWNYDPVDKQWYVYGHGTVSPDAAKVIPDEDTRLWTLDGAMFNTPGNPKPDKPWWEDLLDKLDGDPVDLSTGLLVDSKTDLGVTDALPISLTREYYQGDNHNREFGLNSGADFNMFMASENQYQEVDIYTPGGGRAHYARTSPGTGYSDAVFSAVGSPGKFTGSTIAQVNGDWVLTLRDGTKWLFPWYSRPRAMQDRNGNQVTFVRSGGNNGEVTQIVSPNGRWIGLEYDASARVSLATDNIGRAVTYTYDTAGRLATVTDVGGKVTTYTYDTAHRITRITDARGIAYLDVAYDANGRVQRQNLADGGSYQFAYTLDAAGGITETRVTQPDGSVRRVTFDANRMIATDTSAFGTASARTTTYLRSQDNRIDAEVDPYGRRSEYTYDAAGRPTAITELAGTADAHVAARITYGPFAQPLTTTDAAGKTTTNTYDAKGNLLTSTDPVGRRTTFTRTGSGQVATQTSPTGGVTTYTYEAGSPVSVKDPLNRVAKTFFDAAGRPVATTDPAGAVTLTKYNAQNLPISITDPIGGTQLLGHDENGNLTSFTDARGKTTSYTYDQADRRTSATDPRGKTATATYDAAGRTTAIVSKAGKRTEYTHNALGMVTKVRYGVTSPTAQQSEITYAYDSADRPTSLTDSAGGTVSFTYDARDRVLTETRPTGTVGYGYDAANRQIGTTAPGVAATSYTYDDAGVLTGASQGAEAVVVTHDAAGRPTGMTMPGGWAQTRTYDAAGRLTRITYTQAGAPKGELTYAYDAAGRVSSVGGSLAAVRLPTPRTGLVYDDANRLVTAGTTPLTHDDDGNLLDDGTTTYTWDARGKLTASTRTDLSATYTYDALGERTSRTVGSTTTRFVYDNGNVAAEQDGTGALTASLLSTDIDQWQARTTAGVTDTALTDAQGSVIGFGRSDGSVAATRSYDPFGLPATTGDARGSDLSYTGRQDDGTGLLQYRQRYYSPALQRFVSEDPIDIAGGTNLFAYVENSPANYVDPTGEHPAVAGCVVGGLAGAGWSAGGDLLSGRKVDWGAAAGAAAAGCLGGAGLGALGKLLAGSKFLQNGNNLLRIGRPHPLAKPRVSIGPAPKHYNKMGPIGKALSPIHVHIERGKAGIDFNWIGKDFWKTW